MTTWENGDYEISLEHGEVEEPEEYTLEVNMKGEGTTDPEPGEHTFEAGERVVLEAEPDEGWEFDSWSNYLEPEDPILGFDMPAENVTMIAIFEEIKEEDDEEGEDETDGLKDDLCTLSIFVVLVGVAGIIIYKKSKH